MNLKMLSLALTVGLSAGVAFAQNAVVGYYPYWAQYSQFKPSDVHYERVSQIHYSAFSPAADGSIAFTDESDSPNFDSLAMLSGKNNVSLIAVIGGTETEDALVSIAADESVRSTFTQNVAELVSKYNLAGVEIDWQNLTEENTANYAALISALKETLADKIVSASVYSSSADFYGEALSQLDQIVVMIGDQMTEESENVQPNLKLDDVTAAVEVFASKGVDKSKMIPVVSLTGKSFMGANGLGTAHQGVGSGNEGLLSYAELMKKFDSPDYTVSFDEATSSEVAVGNGETIVFSGIPSVKAVCSWAKENGLGGVALFDISQDHAEPIISLFVTAGLVLRPDVNYAGEKKK